MFFCFKSNIQILLSRKSSNNVYFVRNLCLGGDVMRGENQKPFNSEIPYDYILWIDSDMVFSPQHFTQLLSRQADIISGLYLMEGGKLFATCKDWDEEFFKQNGHFKFLSPEDMKDAKEPFEVSYTGMGFMLVKHGVFESMEYPWFRPFEKRIGNMVDFTMEDVAFCLKAKEKGFSVLVDPLVRVGHEKRVVL